MKQRILLADKNSSYARILREKLGARIIFTDYKQFADTESYVVIEDEASYENADCFLLFHFEKKKSINEMLMPFLFLCDKLRKKGLQNIHAIFPYIPYCRGPLDSLHKILAAVGISTLFTTELHEPFSHNEKPFIHEMKMHDFWFSHLTKMFGAFHDDLIVVSPDAGGKERVQQFAKKADLVPIVMKKERFAPDESRVVSCDGDIAGKNIIILDDIISTGTTAINAAQVLQKQGARKIIGCFTHALFSHDAQKKIEESLFEKIFITDTILRDKDWKSEKIISISCADEFATWVVQTHSFLL